MKTKHPAGTKSWIVYGPQGCGKTRNAKVLANALKLNIICDDWRPDQRASITDHLILTQDRPQEDTCLRVMSYDDAMKLVRARK